MESPHHPQESQFGQITHITYIRGCSGEMMSQRELDIGLGFGLVRVQIKVLSAWTDHRNHLWSRDVMGAHTRLVLLGGVRPERNYT